VAAADFYPQMAADFADTEFSLSFRKICGHLRNLRILLRGHSATIVRNYVS
jgi:hypothetical protein